MKLESPVAQPRHSSSYVPVFFMGRIDDNKTGNKGRPVKYDTFFHFGDKVGCWTILDDKPIRIRSKISNPRDDHRVRATYYVHVQCVCGNVQWVKAAYLATRKPNSCSKCRAEKRDGCFRTVPKEMRYWHNYYNGLRGRSGKVGIPFNLTPRYLKELYDSQDGRCALTGIPISRELKNISVDRKSPKEGYVIGNVHFVDLRVNKMKQDFTVEQFLGMCKTVLDYSKLLRTTEEKEHGDDCNYGQPL